MLFISCCRFSSSVMGVFILTIETKIDAREGIEPSLPGSKPGVMTIILTSREYRCFVRLEQREILCKLPTTGMEHCWVAVGN